MPLAREQRKLAAILFADAVGSSRLMGRDESGTVARLLEHLNRRLAPAAARRGGRVIRLTGDGGLVEFGSAVDALAAAIDFQQSMLEANRDQLDDKAIVFRIGLHLGDVIVEGDDIYGDDVNVAARQALYCCATVPEHVGDPEQEYFADGMVEDIITALSRAKPAVRDRPQLDASPTRAESPDIRQVGRELASDTF